MLRPGGTPQLTMLSKRNRAFGIGREIRPDTFVDDAGTGDKAHPHFYVDATTLTAMLPRRTSMGGRSWTSTRSARVPFIGRCWPRVASTAVAWLIGCSSSPRSRRMRRARGRARRARPGRGRRRAGRGAPRSRCRSASTTSARSTRPRCATPRALALFTIGETPWSAEQQAAIVDRVRAGQPRGALDPLLDRLVLRVGRVRRAGGCPLRRPSLDADVHRGRARSSAPCVRAPRCRVGVARRGVPVPRPATRRADAAARACGELDLTAPGARPPAFGYPLAWCFAEGDGRVFSTSLGHFPHAWETPAYLQHLVGGLGWALGGARERSRSA